MTQLVSSVPNYSDASSQTSQYPEIPCLSNLDNLDNELYELFPTLIAGDPCSDSFVDIISTESEREESPFLGDYVRAQREKCTLSQLEIARLTHIDNRVLSLIEHHQRKISHDEAKILAPVLQITAETLLSKKLRQLPLNVFAIRLKELRKEKKLLQTQLSKLSSVDYRIISEVERGKRELAFDQAERIAKVLETKPEELLSEDAILFGKRLKDTCKPPLCQTLKKLREDKALTIHSFARISRLSSKHIAKYESEACAVKLRTVKKIACGFKMPLAQMCA